MICQVFSFPVVWSEKSFKSFKQAMHLFSIQLSLFSVCYCYQFDFVVNKRYYKSAVTAIVREVLASR